MKHIAFVLLFLLSGLTVAAQKIGLPRQEEPPAAPGTRMFRDVEGGYEIELTDGWRTEIAVENDGRRTTEIIYRDRSFGLLKIRKEAPDADTPADKSPVTVRIDREIDSDLRFRPAYSLVTRERFVNNAGGGEMLQVNYKRGGRPTTGRFYYVQTDKSTIWVLRFTGNKEYLDKLRHLTDQMARTFRPLP